MFYFWFIVLCSVNWDDRELKLNSLTILIYCQLPTSPFMRFIKEYHAH